MLVPLTQSNHATTELLSGNEGKIFPFPLTARWYSNLSSGDVDSTDYRYRNQRSRSSFVVPAISSFHNRIVRTIFDCPLCRFHRRYPRDEGVERVLPRSKNGMQLPVNNYLISSARNRFPRVKRCCPPLKSVHRAGENYVVYEQGHGGGPEIGPAFRRETQLTVNFNRRAQIPLNSKPNSSQLIVKLLAVSFCSTWFR